MQKYAIGFFHVSVEVTSKKHSPMLQETHYPWETEEQKTFQRDLRNSEWMVYLT